VEDELLFKSDRIVVPRSLRAEVLHEIHGAHMGESKSLSFTGQILCLLAFNDRPDYRQSQLLLNLQSLLRESLRPAPGQMKLAERPAGNAQRSPIATRSGAQVRKPQRLIESC